MLLMVSENIFLNIRDKKYLSGMAKPMNEGKFGYPKSGIHSNKVYTNHKTLIKHFSVYDVRKPAFWVGAVGGRGSQLSINLLFCPRVITTFPVFCPVSTYLYASTICSKE
jgi:hypothetical protein